MASLRRKKDSGLYYVIWTDKHRRPHQVSETLKTTEPKRAKYLQRKLEIDYHEGKHDPWIQKWFEKPPEYYRSNAMEEVVAEYLDHKRSTKGRKGWSQTTYKAKKYILELLSKHNGNDRPVKSITSNGLQKFYYRPEVKSDHTRQGQRRTVIAFLNWCREHGFIDHIPPCDVDMPQEEIPEFFRMAELQVIYEKKKEVVQEYLNKNYSRGHENQLWMIEAWKLAVSTGLRRTELMNLRLPAINMDEESILVGYQHRTKSARQRLIPFLFEAGDVLAKYTDPDYRARDKYLSQTDLIFGRQGEQMAKRLNSELVRIRKLVLPGRPELTLHGLRHTFAIRYLSAPSKGDAMDFRLQKLKDILGHSSITTTEKYLKAIPANLRL